MEQMGRKFILYYRLVIALVDIYLIYIFYSQYSPATKSLWASHCLLTSLIAMKLSNRVVSSSFTYNSVKSNLRIDQICLSFVVFVASGSFFFYLANQLGTNDIRPVSINAKQHSTCCCSTFFTWCNVFWHFSAKILK